MNPQQSQEQIHAPAINIPLVVPISDREVQMLLGTIPEYYPGSNLSLFIQKVN